MFGAREDWRFSELKSRLRGHWWWASFFVTYVSQQLMLVGITLPLYAVHSSPEPWDPLVDTAIALVCAAGAALALAHHGIPAYAIAMQRVLLQHLVKQPGPWQLDHRNSTGMSSRQILTLLCYELRSVHLTASTGLLP